MPWKNDNPAAWAWVAIDLIPLFPETLMPIRHFLRNALALASACLALTAHSQEFPPKKTITMVVGFAAGGAADTGARIIAKKLGENIGASVVIDNRAGAGGNIAHQYTAQGPVDGSLILFGSVGPLTIAQHMMKLPYDPVKDLAPLTMGVNFPNVLVVGAHTGIKTFADFVAYAKKNPGKLDFASTGAASASHLAGELLNDMAKIDTVHIPYKGGAPALQDLLGGRVAAYYSTLSTSLPHIETGKLIPLASTDSLAQDPDHCRIRLPRLHGHQLVCLCCFLQGAQTRAGPLEPGAGEGAQVARCGRSPQQPRPHPPAGDA
jgi:tripartite-type tricarboxylate transporter receptor subunit TctC